MFNPQPKPEKKAKKEKTRIKQSSKKRTTENNLYLSLRKIYLENHVGCECCQIEKATEVHHKKGRQGYADKESKLKEIPLLTDIKYFLAVCHDCHVKIELNPTWAKEKGFSINRIN